MNGKMHRDLGDWDSPHRLDQLEVFGFGRDWWLGRTGISLDAVARWCDRGWVSFDIRDTPTLDEGQTCEILFVYNLALSGLSDLQIERWLGELEPPYRYDPLRVAYSFTYGWVEVPPAPSDLQVDDFMRRKLSGWLNEKALLGEEDVLQEVVFALSREMVELRKRKAQTTTDHRMAL